MIPRYTRAKMREIWSEERKFQTWLEVELATAQARCVLHEYTDPEIMEILRRHAKFGVEAIELLEATLHHDLLAFVENVRSYVPEGYKHYIHDRTTSYDTEVPALAIQLIQAINQLRGEVQRVIRALRAQATRHAWTFCMGITHCQHAKPTTFGWRLCLYLELMEEAEKRLFELLQAVRQVKVSGAVGNYMTISPRLEAKVCEILQLSVRPAATQIVARDVFARVLSEIATIGGCIEKMATDLRLMAQTSVREIEEPFGKGQKGSSAMPHKRNPIMLERMSGMAIALRGYAAMGQELIRTWLERDIAHSSVERICLPDATTLLDYMLDKMAWIIEGMVVHRERMWQNIGLTHGCWASEEAKALLEAKGFAPEEVYKYLQACAFEAMDKGEEFVDVMRRTSFPPTGGPISDILTDAELSECFDFVRNIQDGLRQAYRRMHIEFDEALSNNVPK